MELPINYDKTHFSIRKQAREQYVVEQGGLCWHCHGELEKPAKDRRVVNKRLFPPTMFKYPVHLHHDRKTGMTVGAVHSHCNAVLWEYLGE